MILPGFKNLISSQKTSDIQHALFKGHISYIRVYVCSMWGKFACSTNQDWQSLLFWIYFMIPLSSQLLCMAISSFPVDKKIYVWLHNLFATSPQEWFINKTHVCSFFLLLFYYKAMAFTHGPYLNPQPLCGFPLMLRGSILNIVIVRLYFFPPSRKRSLFFRWSYFGASSCSPVSLYMDTSFFFVLLLFNGD